MTIKKLFLGALVLGMFVASSATAATYTWTTSLKLGSTGTQVKDLQKFLNMYPAYQVSTSGAGSPGMETTYFGVKTQEAVKKFQAANGISPVAGYFGPITRAKAMAMQDGGTTTTPGNLPVGCTSTSGFSPVTGVSCASGNTGTQTGSVVASLAASNPASGYIIDGQATAGLLDVTFTGNGIVNSVTLQRSGISDQNTLDNVYLYDGSTRLTDGYSFNSASQIVMNNLNLAVSGSRTISVKADADASASADSTIAVALVSFTAGTSVNAVNIKGNDMFLAAGSSVASASLSANTVTGSPTVNAGISAYTFWSAPIQINTHAVNLKSAAFRMIGSAPSDAVSNIKLYVDGLDTGVTATVTSITGSNYAMFDFSSMPKSLSTGSHTLDVRGNVEKGSARTVQFSVQQAADLMVFDPQVGVNIAVGGTIPNSAASVSINSGSLTINNDPTFQALTTVTGGASNVTIAKFKLHAYGEDVKVTTLDVTIDLEDTTTMVPAEDGLEDVTLYFNGSQVGSQQDLGASGDTLTFTPGSQMIAPAGTDSWLEVRANVRIPDGAAYTAGDITVTLDAGSDNAQGQNSYTLIDTPSVQSNLLDVQTGLLAVTKSTAYANSTATPNTTGVKLGSYTLQNQSSSESIRVTSLAVAVAYGAGVESTNLSALRTSEASGSGSQPQQPTTCLTATPCTSATNTFSTDFTLAPGATKTVDIFADTGSDTTGTVTFITTLTASFIGVTSNVASTDNDTGQTITVSVGTLGTPTLVTASATAAQFIAAGNGGATDATKATYNFVSTGGASTISELRFNVAAGSGTVTSIRVGSASGTPDSSDVVRITGLNLQVPNGGSGLTQDVFISYAPVGTNGIAPNTSSQIELDYVKYTSGGTTSTDTSLGITAPTMTMVGSKPTVSVNTSTNTGLNIGTVENKIGEITITADSKGSIKLNDIQFAVSASGFTTNPTFTLARIADGTTTITGSSCGQGTAAAASQTIFCEFGTSGNTFTTTTGVANVEVNTDFDGYTIAAGTSKTFSLYATVNGANTGSNDASISSSLVAAGLNWDDTSYATFVADASAASPSAGTNLTGASIYNFPSGSYTITQ